MRVTAIDKPFRHWILDDITSSPSALLHYQQYLPFQAGDLGTLESYNNELERKQTSRNVVVFTPWLRDLFADLTSQDFTNRLQIALGTDISNLRADETLHGGGIHVMRPGDYLGVHLDYALHPKLSPLMERRLNLILFLVPEWRKDWGGELGLYDDTGSECLSWISPAPYRAAIWEPSDVAFHGTFPISEHAKQLRSTCNIYFVSPARPTAVRKRALFVPRREDHGKGSFD